MWKTLKWSGVVLAALAVAACDRTPVEPMLDADPTTDAVAAAAAVDAWDLLVSEEEIQLATFEAVAANPVADVHILQAGEFEADALAAERGGEAGVASAMRSWADMAYFEAAVAVMGSTFVAQAVSSVDAAVGQVEAAIAGSPTSSSVRNTVDAARGAIDQAGSDRTRGDEADALRGAVDAADRLRDLSPEHRAKHHVEAALRLLAKAQELVGPYTRPEILEILREAEAACQEAVRALDAGEWEAAVSAARECTALAKRVIRLLSSDIPDDRLEEHAKGAVSQAEDLYGRAVELAGDDPIPEVRRALDEARDLLRQAEEALAREEWREAIALAHQSAALSRRVIGFLTHDRPSDGLQARAEASVEHAEELYERAVGLAGDDPRPEIAEYLGQARGLINEANAALTGHDWRTAIAKAREASRILYKVIGLLSDVRVVTDVQP